MVRSIGVAGVDTAAATADALTLAGADSVCSEHSAALRAEFGQPEDPFASAVVTEEQHCSSGLAVDGSASGHYRHDGGERVPGPHG